MGEPDPPVLPPSGRSFGPVTGLRVGTIVGGLVGAAATVIVGADAAWLVIVAGVLGGAIGYRSQRRARPE